MGFQDYLRIAMLGLALGFTQAVFAAGPETGTGGDSACSEFVSTARAVGIALKSKGDDFIKKVNPIISESEINSIVRRLKCVPRESLDREARSNVETFTTSLDRNKWAKLDD